MDISVIFKIAAIGVLITVICQILKKSDRDDIATLVALAGLIIVLSLVVNMVGELFQSLSGIIDLYG
ncbi:MAG: stage III sporulation protein AC [Clostridia bacterium]|nr:stage III sporulation protein AC [Clostridia bacterium]